SRHRLAGGPWAGAQARDAGPLQCGDRRASLFELLQGVRHTLLLFPGTRSGRPGWLRLARLAASTERAHRGLIDCHLVAAAPDAVPADLPAGTSIVLDLERTLHGRYDAGSECLYLIRPDGYVGYRSAPAVPGPLREYLERIFTVSS